MKQTNPISSPPRGWRRFLYLGPGLVWAASSVGVAELVFATRAGALFGTVLLWAPLLSIFLKYFTTEMVGRYTIATGENVVQAFARVELRLGPLKLPRGWILWLFWIFFAASIAGMSGIALAVGSCLAGFFPAYSYVLWSVISIIAVGGILAFRRYRVLEWISRVLVFIMLFFTFYSLIKASPPAGELAGSLLPRVPMNSLPELIPLLGWAGAGAIGTIWFSLWTQGSGRGMAGVRDKSIVPDERAVRGWISLGGFDLAVNTVITGLLTAGFLLAGAVILKPLHLVPHGERIGPALSRIAGASMGPLTEAVFLTGVFATLFSTLLADIDGLCRMAAASSQRRRGDGDHSRRYILFLSIYVVCIGGCAAAVPAPVILLQLAAAIDTLLLPVVILLTLHICRTRLSQAYHPNRFIRSMAWFSVAFFAFFVVLLAVSIARGVHFGL